MDILNRELEAVVSFVEEVRKCEHLIANTSSLKIMVFILGTAKISDASNAMIASALLNNVKQHTSVDGHIAQTVQVFMHMLNHGGGGQQVADFLIARIGECKSRLNRDSHNRTFDIIQRTSLDDERKAKLREAVLDNHKKYPNFTNEEFDKSDNLREWVQKLARLAQQLGLRDDLKDITASHSDSDSNEEEEDVEEPEHDQHEKHDETSSDSEADGSQRKVGDGEPLPKKRSLEGDVDWFLRAVAPFSGESDENKIKGATEALTKVMRGVPSSFQNIVRSHMVSILFTLVDWDKGGQEKLIEFINGEINKCGQLILPDRIYLQMIKVVIKSDLAKPQKQLLLGSLKLKFAGTNKEDAPELKQEPASDQKPTKDLRSNLTASMLTLIRKDEPNLANFIISEIESCKTTVLDAAQFERFARKLARSDVSEDTKLRLLKALTTNALKFESREVVEIQPGDPMFAECLQFVEKFKAQRG